jgi:hypothetical protein
MIKRRRKVNNQMLETVCAENNGDHFSKNLFPIRKPISRFSDPLIRFVETSRGAAFQRGPASACSRGRCAARRCRSPTTKAARARIPQDRTLCLSFTGTPPASVGNHIFSGFGAEARPAIRRNPSGRPGRSG